MQIDAIKCREEGHDSYGRIEQVAEQTMPARLVIPTQRDFKSILKCLLEWNKSRHVQTCRGDKIRDRRSLLRKLETKPKHH
jgi:hypothetical protein